MFCGVSIEAICEIPAPSDLPPLHLVMLHPAILMLSLVHVHPLEQISLFYENLLNLFR